MMYPLDEAFEAVLERVQGEPSAIVNDHRFTTALYRIAVRDGIMNRVGFIDPD